MQFVPVNSPPIKTGEEHEVKRVYAPKPAEAASEAPATIPFNFKPVRKPVPRNPVQQEQVFHERSEDERRKYCRRLQSTPVLYDLRSGTDRRRKNQRKSDVTTAIDEVV